MNFTLPASHYATSALSHPTVRTLAQPGSERLQTRPLKARNFCNDLDGDGVFGLRASRQGVNAAIKSGGLFFMQQDASGVSRERQSRPAFEVRTADAFWAARGADEIRDEAAEIDVFAQGASIQIKRRRFRHRDVEVALQGLHGVVAAIAQVAVEENIAAGHFNVYGRAVQANQPH